MYIGNPLIQSAFLVDTFSGDNSTKIFTMSVAPANTASVLVAVSGVLQDPSTYSVVGTTLTFTQAPPTGTGNISARYLGIPASNVTTTAYRTVTTFTATASQTTFTPPSYTVGFINVYRNGVLLTPTSDYTASNGTTVVLASGAASGDTVIVESFLVSSVLNAIPNTAGSVGSSNLASNLTLAGTTTIQTGITFAANPGGGTQATLNDYETGVWTPVATANSGSLTSYTASGQYTKIGNVVYVLFNVILNNVGSASSFLNISGFPFTASKLSNTTQYAQIPFIVRETYVTGVAYLGYMNGGNTTAVISSTSNAGISWTNTYTYMGSFTYQSNV